MSQHFEISNEPIFTVQQVADQLQLSTATIYALVRRGELAAVRIGLGRGTIRIRESDVARFIETNAIQVRSMPRMKQLAI